jgi:hypothetical protein
MRNRILKRLGFLVVVATGGFCLIAWFTRPTNVISNERFNEGVSLMTEIGIETSFGVPGLDVEGPAELTPRSGRPLRWKEWRNEEGVCVTVGFNEAGECVAVTSTYDPNWIQKIRRWLRMSP